MDPEIETEVLNADSKVSCSKINQLGARKGPEVLQKRYILIWNPLTFMRFISNKDWTLILLKSKDSNSLSALRLFSTKFYLEKNLIFLKLLLGQTI